VEFQTFFTPHVIPGYSVQEELALFVEYE